MQNNPLIKSWLRFKERGGKVTSCSVHLVNQEYLKEAKEWLKTQPYEFNVCGDLLIIKWRKE
jgi:hypothetical protein